jgi:hypothetical protein
MRLLITWFGPMAIAAIVLTGSVSGQSATTATAPQVRASVDRTAVWVGDRVRFTVDIDCPPGVDVLDDDLSKDKLKLDDLDVVESDSSRIDHADGTTRRRFAYTLTTYRANVPTLKIAPLSVRYYVRRAGQRLEDAAPAGEIQVPAVAIAFRSTLPEAQEYSLRDSRTATPRPRLFALAPSLGLALVIVSFAPVIFWTAAAVARRRQRPAHRSVRQVRSDERASLQAARELDLSSEHARREAYTKVDVLVREHLRDMCGVPGRSLTPAEVKPALAARGARIDGDRVAAVLEACERARYAPIDAVPSVEACREAMAEAERLLIE